MVDGQTIVKPSRPKAPSYRGLAPASPRASKAARAASRKSNTRCEVLLRRILWHRGLRYRVAVRELPGCPDIVFAKHNLVVFCDGDFWHGRDLARRLRRLADGHNAPYWMAKIRANARRDVVNNRRLAGAGWRVLRFWETDVLKDPEGAAQKILHAVARRDRVRSLQGASARTRAR